MPDAVFDLLIMSLMCLVIYLCLCRCLLMIWNCIRDKADILHDALHTAKNRLTEWAKLWQLQIAIPKCSAFRISNPQWNVCESVQQVTYSIDGVPLRSAGGISSRRPGGDTLYLQLHSVYCYRWSSVVCLLPPWALHKRQVVLEIRSQTDIQTHRHTRSSQ